VVAMMLMMERQKAPFLLEQLARKVLGLKGVLPLPLMLVWVLE
jgi:hypothetical protein